MLVQICFSKIGIKLARNLGVILLLHILTSPEVHLTYIPQLNKINDNYKPTTTKSNVYHNCIEGLQMMELEDAEYWEACYVTGLENL